MTDAPLPANAAQIDYWNAKAGETWARFQEQLDRQIAPLGDAGIRALAPQPGERILDIGCGCGQTTLALAAEVTPGGSVLGLDISKPMLDVARKRAAGVPNVAFRDADAQTDWAALLILRGAIGAAMGVLDDVLSEDSAHALALARRAWCHMVLGDHAEAEADMATSLSLAPNRLGAWLLQAQMQLLPTAGLSQQVRTSRAQDAIDQTRALLLVQSAQMPQETTKRIARQLDGLQLECWLSGGQLVSAQHWIESLEGADTQNPWHVALAMGLAQRDQHADAEAHLRAVLESQATATLK